MDNKQTLRVLGQRLKNLRLAAGFTQHNVTDGKVHITVSTVKRIESGSNFQMEILLTMVGIYQIPVDEFFHPKWNNLTDCSIHFDNLVRVAQKLQDKYNRLKKVKNFKQVVDMAKAHDCSVSDVLNPKKHSSLKLSDVS